MTGFHHNLLCLAKLQHTLRAQLPAAFTAQKPNLHGDMVGFLGGLAGRRPARLLQGNRVSLGCCVIGARRLDLSAQNISNYKKKQEATESDRQIRNCLA